MYTDKEIANRKTKVHPAIVMPKNWLTVIDETLYKEKLDDYKDWVLSKRDFFVKNYGKESFETFVNIMAPVERKPFLKAGFDLNYSYLDKLIENSTSANKQSFLKEELANKLIVVRENITLIALAENALWRAKQEYSNSSKDLNKSREEIIGLTRECLSLISGNVTVGMAYLDDMQKIMQKDSGQEIPPTKTFIKSLKSLKYKINEKIYANEITGFIVSPEA